MRERLASMVLRPTAPSLALGSAIAVLLIVVETLVLYPLKQVAAANGLAVVYLFGVAVVSIVWGFWLGAATSAASALAFDYFCLGTACTPIDRLVHTRW
jgi:K+-sensing histidine kinase KdpD